MHQQPTSHYCWGVGGQTFVCFFASMSGHIIFFSRLSLQPVGDFQGNSLFRLIFSKQMQWVTVLNKQRARVHCAQMDCLK